MIAFFFLAILVGWEALYFAGFIDPFRYYHPLGALGVLLDTRFLRGFGLVSTELVVTSLVGGAMAAVIAPLILRGSWLVGSTIRFLRFGMWIPYIVYWPLPVWDSWKASFGRTFFLVSLASVSAVVLSGIHSYLLSRSVLNLEEEDARWWLIRTAILQALFITVYSQLWMGSYEWNWYEFTVGGAYAATLVVLLLLFITERLLGTRFDYVSRIRGAILKQEFDRFTLGTLIGSIVIVLVLTLIWQALSLSSLELILSSPPRVLGACYDLFFRRPFFWQNAYVSFLEIFGGLIVGLGASLLLYSILQTHDYLRERLFPFLPLLHITVFFSPVILMWWLGKVSYWQKALGIGLMTLYPILEALWGLRDRPPGLRLLLAIDAALPYAVVMMIFSEAMAATGGLGFSMVIAHSKGDTFYEGIAVALIVLLAFVAVSAIFRTLAKHIYNLGRNSEKGRATGSGLNE